MSCTVPCAAIAEWNRSGKHSCFIKLGRRIQRVHVPHMRLQAPPASSPAVPSTPLLLAGCMRARFCASAFCLTHHMEALGCQLNRRLCCGQRGLLLSQLQEGCTEVAVQHVPALAGLQLQGLQQPHKSSSTPRSMSCQNHTARPRPGSANTTSRVSKTNMRLFSPSLSISTQPAAPAGPGAGLRLTCWYLLIAPCKSPPPARALPSSLNCRQAVPAGQGVTPTRVAGRHTRQQAVLHPHTAALDMRPMLTQLQGGLVHVCWP